MPTINKTGRNNLKIWLEGILKPEFDAQKYADNTELNDMGSHTVEIRGHHTILGNPVTYEFSNAELDFSDDETSIS